MKNFTRAVCVIGLAILMISQTSLAAVGYTVKFLNLANLTGNTKFDVEIWILKTGTSAFRIGNANFWFTYNSAALNNPIVKTHGIYNVTTNNDYDAATLTTGNFSGKDYVSYNVLFNGAGDNGLGQACSNVGDGTLVATIEFNITNPLALTDVTEQLNGYALTTDVGTDVTSLGDWTTGNIVGWALPVEMTSFTASANHLNAQISWSTATEKNNYGFEIERRSTETADAAWAKVGFVQGSGTSNTQHQYSFADQGIVAGHYAYRLKQIDNDGTFKYSQSTEVEIGIVAKEFTLSSNYPNPFNPTTNIEFTLATDGKAVLKIYNAIGQEVAEPFHGEAKAGRIIQARFDASRLASGIYYSRLQTNGKSLVKRMMFIK
jgi:hypothetical protein